MVWGNIFANEEDGVAVVMGTDMFLRVRGALTERESQAGGHTKQRRK